MNDTVEQLFGIWYECLSSGGYRDVFTISPNVSGKSFVDTLGKNN